MQINLYAEDEISMSEAVVDVLGIILDIMMPKRSGYGGASCPRPCNAPAQKHEAFYFRIAGRHGAPNHRNAALLPAGVQQGHRRAYARHAPYAQHQK